MQPFPSVSNSTSPSPPPHLVSFVPSASPRSSHSSRHHVRETRAPSTRPAPSLVISAPINPAPSPQSSPPLFLEPYHQAPGVHSPRISRPFLPEPTSARYFPRVSPTPRIPEVPGLQSPPHPPTHSGEYQAMHTQAGVSIVPTPTRHPDERSDANMQYLAHADLSTRLGWRLHVYSTTTSQRRAKSCRYDGVNSILDGTAAPP